MNIAIDTNVFRKDRAFQKNDMLYLIKLSKLNLINIHIPWIVYQESLSQNTRDITSELNKAESAITSIKKKGLFNRDFQHLDSIVSSIKELKSRVKLSADLNWNDFLESTETQLHEILELHGKSVMTAYFEGGPPYSSLKNRNDIPDAFIYMSIKSIVEKTSPLHFVSDDENLRDSVGKLENCYSYQTLDKIYESNLFLKIQEKYELIEHYSDELLEIKNNINEVEKKITDHILGDMFAEDDQLVSRFDVLQPENEGAIQDITDIQIDKIEINKIKYIDDVFYLPSVVRAKFQIEYFIDKSEYNWDYPRKKMTIIDGNWSNYVMLVSGMFDVEIRAVFTITRDEIISGEFNLNYESLDEDSLEIRNE